MVVFETLLSSAATTVDEEKGNPSWQARADFYIQCILSCLPWGGAELTEVLSFWCLMEISSHFRRHSLVCMQLCITCEINLSSFSR